MPRKKLLSEEQQSQDRGECEMNENEGVLREIIIEEAVSIGASGKHKVGRQNNNDPMQSAL